MRIKAKHILLLSALMAPALTGCGPGFPIMTGEQETLVDNVHRITEENRMIKERLDAVEGGGGGGGIPELREEVSSIRSSIAETNASIEDFRQEFSFVQGSVEETGQKDVQFKESLAAVNGTLMNIDQRLAALEASTGGSGETLESMNTSLAAAQNQLDNLTTSLSMLEKRTAALEEKAAASEAAPAPAEAAAPPAQTGVETPEAMYLRGYKETKANNFTEASEIFSKFLSKYPDHKFAGNSQYWLAEIYYARGDWEMAILEFDKVIKKYSSSEKVPGATLKQGYAFEKLGANKEARVLLEQVVSKFPDSPEAGLAKKRLKSLK